MTDRFDYLSGSHLQSQLLTLKMTSAQVVETSVTNNSLSKDYPHQDDHAKQILLLLSNQVETDLHVKTNQYVRYVAIFVGIIHSVQLSLSWVLIDSFVKFKK